ncbi:hypothetical protein CPC08DRAFT_211746 [Agrocybe pediades]|nr:hypothetical protein CPC08DRAFT_211746 [Agrocybe pediades]
MPRLHGCPKGMDGCLGDEPHLISTFFLLCLQFVFLYFLESYLFYFTSSTSFTLPGHTDNFMDYS